MIDGKKVTLYGSSFLDNREEVSGREVSIEGLSRPGVITSQGLVVFGADDKKVLVNQFQLEDGKVIPATKYGKEEHHVHLELTPEEEAIVEKIQVSLNVFYITY